MGVMMYLDIDPNRIKSKKWKRVYEESLLLVDEYPFMDKYTGICENGCEYFYGAQSAERDDLHDLYGKVRGWRSIGDLWTGSNTEEFEMYADIERYRQRVKMQKEDQEWDILAGRFYPREAYPELEIPDEEAIYSVFSAKTQGQDSHLYLLAIACMVVDRLPDAAAVYGDINVGQCRAAVSWANQFLTKPIGLPVQCEARRLIQRLMKMDSSKKMLESGRILELFFQLTLENRDTKMGEVLREFVPEDAIFAYYKEEFTADKDWLSKEKVREFLELGFEPEELARLLVTDQDGRRMRPQDFFDMLLEMQLHVEKKETYDVTRGDMTNSKPDDIQMLMTRAFGKMLGFGNRNVDAYYPLEEIVQRCKTVMSHFCDVDEMIRGALDRDRERRERLDSPADSLQHFFHEEGGGFSQMVELYQQKQDELEQYDIKNMEEIVYYENGDAIAPEVEQVLRETFEALHSFTDGFEDFKKLNKYGREGFFIHRNRHILIQEETWERIFERIMDDDYIQRFYAISIVNMTSQQICDRMEAILSNLELLDDYWDSTSGTYD